MTWTHPAPWHRRLRCSSDPKRNYDCFGPRDLGRGVIFHAGCDFYNDPPRSGVPVYAVGEGLVHEAGFLNRLAGHGVEIHHDFAYRGNEHLSRGIHLDSTRITVVKGQRVRKGQIIGYVGPAGQQPVRAPHVHWEIRRLTRYRADLPGVAQGQPLDPVAFLEGIPSIGGDTMFCKRGDRGDVVEFWQRYLVAKGHDLRYSGGPPQGIDGIYGPRMARAAAAEFGGDGDSIGPAEAQAMFNVAAVLPKRETVEIRRP